MTPVSAFALDADGVLMVSTDGQVWTYPRGVELQRLSSVDETEEMISSGDLVRAVFPMTPKSAGSGIEIHWTMNLGCYGSSEANAPIGEASLFVNGQRVLGPRWESDTTGASEKGAGCIGGHTVIYHDGGPVTVELRATYIAGNKPLRVMGHYLLVREVA